MRKRFRQIKKGQSLIEVIVALAVVITISVSLISASLVTQKASRSARNTSQATKLAQEKIEEVRVFRDRRGFSSLPSTPSNCYSLKWTNQGDISTWSFYTSDCPGGELITLNGTSFFRKIDLSSPSSKKMLVKVVVSWLESGSTKSVVQSTYLSDWQGI